MELTDELREFADGCGSIARQKLLSIADDIDKEGEKQYVDALLNDGIPVTSDEMAEHGWVRLPKDADGVPIRIEDKLVLQHEVFEKPYVVENIAWDGEDWYFTCNEGFFNVAGWHHYHAPTVEDLLGEFCERHCYVVMDGDKERELIAEYAAKLRLSEGE